MPEALARVIRLIDGAPRILEDGWRLVDSAGQWQEMRNEDQQKAAQAAHATPARGGLLVPLELALAHPEALAPGADGTPSGIWLAPADDPARAVPLFGSIALIGVHFPAFTDGRGYSTAVLLRTRLGWRGELRALGDVLQDQLFALRRVGFDSFALRADRDPVAALQGFKVFSDTYQGSVDDPRPAYRRAGASARVKDERQGLT